MSDHLKALSERYAEVCARVSQAVRAANRSPDTVCLIAVSKTHPFEKIHELYKLGHRDFGENYVQELLEKAKLAEQAGLNDVRWHFIGHLQTNKVKALLGLNPIIHTVDSERLALEISKRWQTRLAQTGVEENVSVFVEVNVDREASKSGVMPQEVESFLAELSRVQGISIRGLMCIPEPKSGTSGEGFESLVECARRSRAHHQGALSMGMTQDFERAIAMGSTHVRVGTAIFGARS